MAADIEHHRHGIPLPTEPDPDLEQELLDRLHVTVATNLVIIDDPSATSVADLVATIPRTELHARARHARDTEHACGSRRPATDRDNVGHVVGLDDEAGTCTVHFESTDGRCATRISTGPNSSSSTTQTRGSSQKADTQESLVRAS